MPADPLADDERDLVLQGEVARIEKRDLDLGGARLEGDGVTTPRDFCGEHPENVLGNAAQVLRRCAGYAVLRGESAAELFLGQGFDLEQARPEPSAEDFLVAQSAQELFPRDVTTLLEKLTQAGWSSAQLDP